MEESLLDDAVQGRRLWLGFLVVVAAILIGGALLVLWTCGYI
jgi:hypothetical protein